VQYAYYYFSRCTIKELTYTDQYAIVFNIRNFAIVIKHFG